MLTRDTDTDTDTDTDIDTDTDTDIDTDIDIDTAGDRNTSLRHESKVDCTWTQPLDTKMREREREREREKERVDLTRRLTAQT